MFVLRLSFASQKRRTTVPHQTLSMRSGVTKSVQFSVVCVVGVRLGSSHIFIHSDIYVADVLIFCRHLFMK